MNTTPAKIADADSIMENLIIGGDMSKLSPRERTIHYVRVCKSLGLNPTTQPFAYMNLQGKLLLYAKKDCADQLRSIRGISIEIVSQGLNDDLYSVHVQATDKTGRKDEDLGVVPLPSNVKGEFRSNMIMKAITKAKRRATLSICGLGFLDELEVDSIADAKVEPAPSAEQLTLAEEMQNEIPEEFGEPNAAPSGFQGVDQAAGASPNPSPAATISIKDRAIEAAKSGGSKGVQYLFSKCSSKEKAELKKEFGEDGKGLVKFYPTEGG